MALEKWMQTLWLVLSALLVTAKGATLEKLDCSSALPTCESEVDYARCLEPEDRRQPAEQWRTACYCAGGLPRRCADLCDNSSSGDSGIECRRLCSEYSACLDARGVAATPADDVVNGPSHPLPSKIGAVTPEIRAGSQPPGARPHSSHPETSIARDGEMKALVLNALKQWWVPALLVIAFVALIVYGIVKMRYCHDDSRPDNGKHPPKATAVYSAQGASGDFAYRPLAA